VELSIYQVAASDWTLSIDGRDTILSRRIELETSFGERVQHVSFRLVKRDGGGRGFLLTVAVNFKIIEPDAYTNSPEEGDWLVAKIKHGDQILGHFTGQCKNTSPGSIFLVPEPAETQKFVAGLCSDLNFFVELHGPDGVLDALYFPYDENFPRMYKSFLNA